MTLMKIAVGSMNSVKHEAVQTVIGAFFGGETTVVAVSVDSGVPPQPVNGQISELVRCLNHEAGAPCVLVGFSWGAWLAWLTAARHPDCVKKIILVGSGPFESRYAVSLMDVRLIHLDPKEQLEVRALLSLLETGGLEDRNKRLRRLGDLTGEQAVDPLGECGLLLGAQGESEAAEQHLLGPLDSLVVLGKGPGDLGLLVAIQVQGDTKRLELAIGQLRACRPGAPPTPSKRLPEDRLNQQPNAQ